MPKSLLLSRKEWDLCLDANGDIAVCDSPYEPAQSVATAIKTFQGDDVWFDLSKGLPWREQILGKYPPLAWLRAQIEQCAMTQDGIVAASLRNLALIDRQVTGQILVTDNAGNEQLVNF